MRIKPHLNTSIILVVVAFIMVLGYKYMYLQSGNDLSHFSGSCMCILIGTFVMRSIVWNHYHQDTESLRANISRCVRYYSLYLISFLVFMWIITQSFGQSILLTFGLLLAGIMVIEPARNQLFTKRWRMFLRFLWIAFVLLFAGIAIVYHPEWAQVGSVVIVFLAYLFLSLLLTFIFRKYALQSH